MTQILLIYQDEIADSEAKVPFHLKLKYLILFDKKKVEGFETNYSSFRKFALFIRRKL